MSFSSWDDNCLTPLERAAGVGSLLRGGGHCHCGRWECDLDHSDDPDERNIQIEKSKKYKAAIKICAGMDKNREIKQALMHRVYQDSLQSAIVRYMTIEKLPAFYASIIRHSLCIDKLIKGVLYKVCKVEPMPSLDDEICTLSISLRNNIDRVTAYDRVTKIQQFIYKVVDQRFGIGSARYIPVNPMKHALSAARLNFNISDLTEKKAGYIEYMNAVSFASVELEYSNPRPSTANSGKRSWPRWRVRHIRPLFYYFPERHRLTIQAMKELDMNLSVEKFIHDIVILYAEK